MLTTPTLTSVTPVVDTVNMQATRPYHHGRLRETLVDAGLELSRSGGPDAVVLRAVSRGAGVSHNAAYRHFADHDELLAAVAEQCMARLAALMERRTAEITEADPVDRAWARLDGLGRAYVEFALTEPGWFRTAFTGAKGPDEDVATEGEPGPYELLGARLDELVAVGAMPADLRPGAEFPAWSGVHGLSHLLVEGPLRGLGEAEVAAAVDTVLAAVRRGLEAVRPPSAG